MDKLPLERKHLISITLSTIGVILGVFSPFFGYFLLIPSLILTSKRENISLLHLFVFNIVALISITIITIISIAQSVALN